jgi:hypothetical protein
LNGPDVEAVAREHHEKAGDAHVAPLQGTARKGMAADEVREQREQHARGEEANRRKQRGRQVIHGDLGEQKARSPHEVDGHEAHRELR